MRKKFFVEVESVLRGFGERTILTLHFLLFSLYFESDERIKIV